MQLAFYRGDGSTFGRVIQWWTGTITLDDGRVVGPYVHVELVFSDGTWFSSDEHDGGTRFKRVRLAANDTRWRFITLPLTPEQEAVVFARAKLIDKLGYDFWGIFKAWWRPAKESADRWFCSEACLYCLQGAGLFLGTPPWRATPVDLAALAVAVFGEAK